MLVCLSEGDLEGNLLVCRHCHAGSEGTASLGVSEGEVSEVNSHVHDITSTEHEGAEVRGVVILVGETSRILVEHLRYNGLEVISGVVDQGLDETDSKVTSRGTINLTTQREVSHGLRVTGQVHLVLDGSIVGDSDSCGGVAEEVHGDVTDEEVTDGSVTLVLFTISGGTIGGKDR
jgi:hypothetical protein